jgi:hypothetical protein
MMTPTATGATRGDAAAIPSPMTQGDLLHARRVPNKSPAEAM